MNDGNPILILFSFLTEVVTAIGVVIAAWQLRQGRNQAVTTFEDALASKYRELAAELGSKPFLDDGALSDEEYEEAFDTFYRYFDFSNEQVYLRQIGRVRKETWVYWCDGIRSNMNRAAFSKAWADVSKRAGGDFRELRRLVDTSFKRDPHNWE
jgi:hypothetical protein